MDTTSLYFEGAGGQTLGRRGYSKDHRPDLAREQAFFDDVLEAARCKRGASALVVALVAVVAVVAAVAMAAAA
jgi:hypothetical protein